ncbi:MAG: hypothetical protein FD147_2458 [Chloroflexi bacterium]|nr:MAG: hypothetical protein FD147_2458 [Chloroflexota bacterium]MBA4376350.1 GrpB family protein [Anaerolinea sp.]
MTDSPSPIVIEPSNPNWLILFQSEAALIQSVIGSYITSIEHIGSTAVPGLAAKPVIDILIGVQRVADSPLFLPPLTALGYIYRPEFESELPERRYLLKMKDGKHTHHLHIVESTTQFFRKELAFRDYLRMHPETAEAYATLKYELAKKFGSDRAGYTDAKTAFIQDVLGKTTQ